jgi:phage terminase large subunit
MPRPVKGEKTPGSGRKPGTPNADTRTLEAICVKIKLQPKQKLFRQALNDYPIVAFGGARGGGKSYAVRNIFLLRMLEQPGRSGVIFRKSFPELESNHIRPLFQEHPGLREFWNESKKLLSLPNGSTLQFSHCSNETDAYLYQGREYSDFAFDEAGQITEGLFRTLLGSNRSSKPGIKPACAISMNPGGIGHGWIKRLFIEKKFNERERPQDYYFIQSLISDNEKAELTRSGNDG